MSPGGWNYTGVASGNITFHVESPPQYGTKSVQMSVVTLPLKVNIIPTPAREKRVLWDVLHSIKYPPGYVPRDNLDIKVRRGSAAAALPGASQGPVEMCECVCEVCGTVHVEQRLWRAHTHRRLDSLTCHHVCVHVCRRTSGLCLVCCGQLR